MNITEHEELSVGEGGSAAVTHTTCVLRLVVDAARQHRQRTRASIRVFHYFHAVHAADDQVLLGAGVHQSAVDVPVDGRSRPAVEEHRENGRIAARHRLVLESERKRRRLVECDDRRGSVRWRQRVDDAGRWLERKDNFDSRRQRLSCGDWRETR